MQGVAKLAKVLECGAKPSAHGAAVLLLVVLVLHSGAVASSATKSYLLASGATPN